MENEGPEIGFLLPLAGLGIAAAAAAVTLIDRAVNPEQQWWWERLSPPSKSTPEVKKPREDHSLVFPHTEEEKEHSRVYPHSRIKRPDEEGPSYPPMPHYPAIRAEI